MHMYVCLHVCVHADICMGYQTNKRISTTLKLFEAYTGYYLNIFINAITFSVVACWGSCERFSCVYRIALNYGPAIYFFPAIFTQATKQDRHY